MTTSSFNAVAVTAVSAEPALTTAAQEATPLVRRRHTLASRLAFLVICLSIAVTTLAFGTVHSWALALLCGLAAGQLPVFPWFRLAPVLLSALGLVGSFVVYFYLPGSRRWHLYLLPMIIGGLYLLLVPSGAGKPTTTKEKVVGMIVFAIGLAAGLVNWYLMDPGFFGR